MDNFQAFSELEWERENAGKPVIYRTDGLSREFRNKAALALELAIGTTGDDQELWREIIRGIHRTKGFSLSYGRGFESHAVLGFIQSMDSDELLTLEFIYAGLFLLHTDYFAGYTMYMNRANNIPKAEAVKRVNAAFKRHGLGYQYHNGHLIRLTSEWLYDEVTEPAISLMFEENFTGPLDEFMRAYEHFRKGENDDAMHDANKALEGTMRTVLARRGRSVAANERAEQLIPKVFGALVPPYIANNLGTLKTLLQALPSLRSNTPGVGHTQGVEPSDIPDHLASYALHLAASNIVFLIEAYRDLEKREPMKDSERLSVPE